MGRAAALLMEVAAFPVRVAPGIRQVFHHLKEVMVEVHIVHHPEETVVAVVAHRLLAQQQRQLMEVTAERELRRLFLVLA